MRTILSRIHVDEKDRYNRADDHSVDHEVGIINRIPAVDVFSILKIKDITIFIIL